MEEGNFPIDDFEAKLGRLLETMLEQVAVVFGLEVFDTAKSFMPNLETKAEEQDFRKVVRTWLRKHALKNAKSISTHLKELVREALKDQFKEGFGEREAIRRVAKILATGKAYHIAQRIARTEAHTAATVGQHKAAETSGVDLVKEWGATEDMRTRESHAKADNQTREMWDKFNVGESLLEHPGDPAGPPGEIINCRCVALYWPRAVAPHPVTSSGVVPPPAPKPAVTGAKPKPNDEQLDTDFSDLAPPVFIPPDPSPGLVEQAIQFAWDALIYTRSKLSQDGYEAARKYQGSGYRNWNKALRTNSVVPRGMYRDTLAMDRGFDAWELTQRGTVYRGGVFTQGDKLIDKATGAIPIGTKFQDNGFISVSTDYDTAVSFGKKANGFTFRIDLEPGTPIFGIKPLKFGNSHENEIVLPRGTQFEVIRQLGKWEYLIRIIGNNKPSLRAKKADARGRHSPDKFTWFGDDVIKL